MEESRSMGSVNLSVYRKYFVAGGGILSFALYLMICIVTQSFLSGTDYWLSLWIDAEQSISNSEISKGANLAVNIQMDTHTWIYVFTAMAISSFGFAVARSFHFFTLCMKSSIKLHNGMFKAVARAPLSFFEDNPVGNFIH